jgi:ribosomal-protein-alanine N-acetyltransferase
MIPTLTTSRLTLRMPTEHDAQAIFAYARHHAVTHFTQWTAHTHIQDTYTFIRNVHHHKKKFWVIELTHEQTVIGECGFILRDNGCAEIHCSLHVAWWGQGIGLEALHTIITYCFQMHNYQQIHAWIIASNIRSERLVQKLSMSHAQTLHNAWFAHDSLHALKLYTLTKDQWLNNKNASLQNRFSHSLPQVLHTQVE